MVMEITTPTPEGIALQTAAHLGIPHTYPAHSTLNEKLGIENGVYPSSTVYPNLKCFVIGSGGSRESIINGHRFQVPVPHVPLDLGLFDPIPFVMREINDDLDATERARFALRRLVTMPDGKIYVTYNAKRISKTGVVVDRQIETIVNGEVTSVNTLAYSSANLTPTPRDLLPNQTTQTSGQQVRVVSRLWVGLDDEWDTKELLKVSRILYGTDYGAFFTEIGMVTAADKDITTNSGAGSTSFTFKEVIGAQIATHIAVNCNVSLGAGLRVGAYVNAGIAEPLFVPS